MAISKVVLNDSTLISVIDTTAEASDVFAGKYFYASNGVKTAGNAINGIANLKDYVIRPDAEKIQTYTYDKYLNTDEKVEIPAYTTTATTLIASKNLSPTITLDYTNYHYYVVERFLAIPTYSVSTKAKGRVEYWIGSSLYEVGDVPANNFIALVDGTTKYTSRSITVCVQSFNRLVYWTGSTAITPYSTAAYGYYETVTAPGISSGVMTVKSPVFGTRGHTTYFTSTYMNKVTDVRYQYVIDVYKAPNNNLNIDGWGCSQQAIHIVNCVNNNNLKLT